jgi:hypothetical protein
VEGCLKWKGVRLRLPRPRQDVAWENGLIAVGMLIWWLALLIVGAIGGAVGQTWKMDELSRTNAELVETNENLWYLFRDRHCALVSCQITVNQWLWKDYPIAETPAIKCLSSSSQEPPFLKAALEPEQTSKDESGSTTHPRAKPGRKK